MIESIANMIVLSIFLLMFYLLLKCNRNNKNLIEILTKNIDILENCYKIKNIKSIQDFTKIVSKLQILSRLSKCDYITLFKYDYNENHAILKFIVSMSNSGKILNNSILSELDLLPATSNLLTINILKTDDKELYSVDIDDAVKYNDYIYQKMLVRDVKKFYYQNIFKNYDSNDRPIGFVILSYKEDYIIPKNIIIEIIRILKTIKNLI